MPELTDDFLQRFHAGERRALRSVYEDYFDAVDRAVARVMVGADRETVVQDVFCRLVGSEALRRNFRGGSLVAWLATVARNEAIDFLRRHRREVPLGEGEDEAQTTDHGRFSEWVDAQLLIARFRREVLPEKWASVFQARFLDQLSQREAAEKLGMARTTLMYQELRVDRLLRKFLLAKESR